MVAKLKIGERILTEEDCFIIAEIGSNHMGDPELCEKMIIEAANCGVDAVKMQKRDNKAMFTKAALSKPYENEFSYGKTYGEHREYLDWFGWSEFQKFKMIAEKHGVLFFATPFEERSVEFLHDLGVPLWKIASCDMRNLPLIEKVAGYGQPLIISTGGASIDEIFDLRSLLMLKNIDFAMLHCISTYPNDDASLNLAVIKKLHDTDPFYLVGFSSHHPGILPLIIARTLGASIFEVHFTLNRSFRGTDHGFSIEPAGLRKLCEDIRRVKVMLGNSDKIVTTEERNGFISKMGKNIYLKTPLGAGTIIKSDDIVFKSPASGGYAPSQADKVINRILIHDLSTGIALKEEMLE